MLRVALCGGIFGVLFVLLVQCCVLLSTVLSIMPLVVYICGMCQSSVFLWFFLCSFLCSCLCVLFFPLKGLPYPIGMLPLYPFIFVFLFLCDCCARKPVVESSITFSFVLSFSFTLSFVLSFAFVHCVNVCGTCPPP